MNKLPDMQIAKTFLLLGSLNAMLAVILGAFGAHGLKSRLAAGMLAVFQTGVQYHFYHALGLILIGIIAMQFTPAMWLKSAGWLMLAGIILFSGSLYILSITGVRWLGAITPLGGLAFILAWLCLCAGIIKH
jgi:Uncharacterized small membrane protein